MSAPTDVLFVTHWEDADLVLMARVQGADASNITQATISSIAIKVFDLTDNSQVSTTLAPAVADVVFDTLQTDDRWTEDSTGYNFRYTVPAAYFPTGGQDYRIEVVFTPTSGGNFPFVAQVTAQGLLSS